MCTSPCFFYNFFLAHELLLQQSMPIAQHTRVSSICSLVRASSLPAARHVSNKAECDPKVHLRHLFDTSQKLCYKERCVQFAFLLRPTWHCCKSRLPRHLFDIRQVFGGKKCAYWKWHTLCAPKQSELQWHAQRLVWNSTAYAVTCNRCLSVVHAAGPSFTATSRIHPMLLLYCMQADECLRYS